eukprot:11219517-Lingulodinium_polyedra.AAC.1
MGRAFAPRRSNDPGRPACAMTRKASLAPFRDKPCALRANRAGPGARTKRPGAGRSVNPPRRSVNRCGRLPYFPGGR